MNTGTVITVIPRTGKGTIKSIILEFDGRVARVCRNYGLNSYKITRRYNITPASRQRIERLTR